MNQKRVNTLFLLLQIIITLVYGAMIVHMTKIIFEETPNSYIDDVVSYLPQFVILLSSIIPQIALRVKRRLHSQDGEIYPLLFTIIAIQATLVIPKYTEVTGIFIVDSSILVSIGRFSLLGSAALFLISALRYYGFNSSKIDIYTSAVLAASLLISLFAPISSTKKENAMNVFNSQYDAYIQMATILLYVTTIITLLVFAIKDKSPINTRRFIGFTLIIVGLHLSTSYEFITAIISSVLYLTGIIILTFNTGESF